MGFVLRAGESQELMDKTEVGFLQNPKTGGGISMEIFFVVKIALFSHKVRAN
jgi:hypothetical protein